MKKLLSLLAVAALLPAAANADVLKNVNIKGEIQTIASDVRHNDDTLGTNTYNRGASARVLAGLSADLVEDVTANLMFQYANVWGQDDAAGKPVQNYWNEVRLVEANVVLHNLFCCLEATVGRQFYGDEDSAVMYIGPNHYNAEANGLTRSLDAAKITYADDVKAFTFIAGRTNYSITDPGFGPSLPDYSLFGADFKLNLTNSVTAQVYGYNLRDVDTTLWGTPTNMGGEYTGFYGAKLAVTPAENSRVSVEYARNYGGDRLVKEHDATGHMVKVDAALGAEKGTVRGAFYYANENFFALGNYTPGLLVGHDLAGNLSQYSADGVALFNLGFDVKPADKWTVSLDGFSFQDHRMKHSSTWEADLTAKYAHNEYVELFAGVGYAKYTGAADVAVYNKTSLKADNVKGQLGMLIKF